MSPTVTPSDDVTPSPLVSVIVATRNRPGELRQCLSAIAAQDHEALDVLVVDDGSSASTREQYPNLCPSLGSRLRWVLFDHPDTPGTGPAAARNRGLQLAQGTFVAFCDDDDRWIRQDHLSCAVRALEATGADFFFTDFIATREGVVSDHVWYPEVHLLKNRPAIAEGPVVAVDLATVLRVVSGYVIHPDLWVVRRSLLDEVGGFWERLWFGEDFNLMMRILDRARSVLYRPVACADYRLPVADSVSLQNPFLQSTLQDIMAMQHVRMVCQQTLVRRHARARAAYGLRRLARLQRGNGNRQEGAMFAWQALCTYPTIGALWEFLWGRTP
jgi:glycosyltransferase involved in cell wall biosynthesis